MKKNLDNIDPSLDPLKTQTRVSKDCVSGTAEWFETNDAFQSWLSSPISSTLCFFGGLGSGKTFLTSRVISRLSRNFNAALSLISTLTITTAIRPF